MVDRAISGTIEEVAEQAQRILTSVLPVAFCVAQEWDNRIDCVVNLSDGSCAGEMISLPKVTERRVREAGERLKLRQQGAKVQLEDELWRPIPIRPGPN
jgi:hypothetical protein